MTVQVEVIFDLHRFLLLRRILRWTQKIIYQTTTSSTTKMDACFPSTVNHMRATVDNMDDRMYEIYVKYHLATCERQDMVGYSHHTLDIFRKD